MSVYHNTKTEKRKVLTLCEEYAFLISDKRFSGVLAVEELPRLSWNSETLSSLGIIFFIIFGSIALFVQGWKIWKNKSGLSVSVMWTFVFFFMFLAYPIIGSERNNLLMVWQGAFRILFYTPIVIGLHRFKGFAPKEIEFAKTLFVMIFLMIEYPFAREFIFTAINFLGVLGVFAQGRLIKEEGKTGVVSATLLFAYATNAMLWIWYNYETGDIFLLINSILFLVAYAYTIAVWLQFRLKEFKKSPYQAVE